MQQTTTETKMFSLCILKNIRVEVFIAKGTVSQDFSLFTEALSPGPLWTAKIVFVFIVNFAFYFWHEMLALYNIQYTYVGYP